MHAREHNRPRSEEEKDDDVASNANDFVDQMGPKEFSQEVEPTYHSPLESPTSNGQGDEDINEQSMRQDAETFALHEVLALELPQVSLEVEILEEGFAEVTHA